MSISRDLNNLITYFILILIRGECEFLNSSHSVRMPALNVNKNISTFIGMSKASYIY